MAKPASKLTQVEVLRTSYYLFYAGFALLPILWFINAIYLYPELKSRPSDQLDPKVKRYVYGSIIGSVGMFIVSFTWFIVFVTSWNKMGIPGEQLTVLIPRGVA